MILKILMLLKYCITRDENFKYDNADLLDLNQLKKSLKNIFGVIILAGLVGDPITKKYPDLSYDIN